MRIAALLLLSSLTIGCGGSDCRDHTLLLSFSLASGVSADTLSITVDVAGTAKTSPLTLKSGTTHGTIEIDFPSGYPSGSTIAVSVSATAGGVASGSGSASVKATGSCEKLSITISAGIQPTNGLDMTLGTPDMTLVANKHQGDACGAKDICDTGHCVDGYCCNDTCGGQCQACDVTGHPGTCMTTTDSVPHGSRPACAGSGTCAGACTGASATACTFPATSVICGAACDGHCDAAGSCSSVAGGMCPNGFACGATGCDTTCASNNDCQPNFHCAAPSCVRDVESDCLDGKDNNGDGLADCQDPTCTTLVQCVPGVPAGDELGIEQATGSTCPTEFGLSEPQNQGLVAPACDTTGCGCDEYVTCDISVSDSTSTSCAARTVLATMRGEELVTTAAVHPNPATATCQNIPSTSVSAFVLNSVNHVSDRCAASGTNSPTPPKWTKSELFCSAPKTSATCTAVGQVCAPVQPSGASLCVRIPASGASCPGGYSTGMNAMWYASYTDNRTCSCDCAAGTGACSSTYAEISYQTGSCPVAQLSGAPGWSFCALDTQSQCVRTDNVGSGTFMNFCSTPSATESVGSIALLDLSVSGQCTPTIDNSGSATPTEGSTICCQ